MIRLRVREIAQAKGISQGKLSRMSDVDDNTIKRIYRNPTAIVSTETINKLARALGVSTMELMEDVPEEQEGDQR
ncbi:MAG: helix-turn-helix transcriptional regulator [Ktedonobacteraceae bacterium]|nr:helix-turn-helix transcriptional regulator [Ktedonobacteraceae bacterium]